MTKLVIATDSIAVSADSPSTFLEGTPTIILSNDTDRNALVTVGSSINQVESIHNFSVTSQNFITYPWSDTGIEDADYDNNMYVRKNGKWVILTIEPFPEIEPDSYLYSEVADLRAWQNIAMGNSPDVDARYISVNELIALGILKRQPGGAVSGVVVPFKEIPPIPQNLKAIREVSTCTLFWEAANLFYSNHGFTEVFRHTSDDLASALKVGQTYSNYTYSESEVLVTDTAYYYWIRFVSEGGEIGPFNATEGTLAVAADPSQLLDILSGAITIDELHPSLSAPIELITAPDGLVNTQIVLAETIAQETLNRIDAVNAEATARQLAVLAEAEDRNTAISTATNILETADLNLAERVDFVTATSNGTFDSKFLWQFDLFPEVGVDTTEGWTNSIGIPEVSSGLIKPAFSSDTWMNSPDFTLDGAIFSDIRMRIKKVGNPVWEGSLYFTTTLDPVFGGYRTLTIAEPVFFAGEAIARWSMVDIADWDISIINGFKFQLSVVSDAANYFLIDWIGVGRIAPAASLAALAEERTAWTTADAAEAALRTTLAAQIRGGYDGSDLDSVSSGLLYEEKIARAEADNALAIQITLLTAGTTTQFDYINIWYFDSTIEGWSGSATPSTLNPGWLRPANGASGVYLESPTISVLGNTYPQIRTRVRKVGSPIFEGRIDYITVADSDWGTAGKSVTILEPSYDEGIAMLTWDMGTPWDSSEITQFRVVLSDEQTVTDYFEIDWFAVGRPSPGASSAELLDLQQVVTTGFTALGEDVTAIEVSLDTKASASSVATLQSEVTDLEGELSSQSSAITAIKSSLGGGNNLVTNSELENSTEGWEFTLGGTATLQESGRNLFITLPQGINTLCGRFSTSGAGVGNLNIASSSVNSPEYLAKITPNSRYCVSAYVAGTSVSTSSVGIAWYDGTGIFISESFSTPTSIPLISAVNSLATMVRIYVFGTAPSNAKYARAVFKANALISTSSAFFIAAKPMVEEVSTSQVIPSIYTTSVVGVASQVFATAEATEALITDVTQIGDSTVAQANQISTLRASIRDDDSEGELASALAGWRSEVLFTEEVAVRVSKDEANLQRFTGLEAETAEATAKITELETTVITNEAAATSAITTMVTAIENNRSALETEILTRTTADSALASSVNTLTTQVSYNGASIVDERTARVNGDYANAYYINILQTNFAQNTAAIVTEANARTSADSSLATLINALTGTVNSNYNVLTGSINTESSIRISQIAAITNVTTTLASTVNGNTSAISISANTLSDIQGDLSAMYSVKLGVTLDGKYYAAGMGIGIENTPSGMQSNVIFIADRFQIMHAIGAGVVPTSPFLVSGGKVFINTAVIGDASITTAKIADASITTAKIVDASITTAKIINASITNAKIGTAAIHSANILDASITNAKIANLAISSAKIEDAAITNAKIGTAAVNTANINDAAITNAKINNAAIDTLKVAGEAITVVRFGQGSSGNIANNTTVTVLTMPSISLPTGMSGVVIVVDATVSTSGPNCNVWIEVYRNGFLIHERHAGAINDMSLCVSATFYDSTPGTSPIYVLKMRAGANPGGGGGGSYYCGSPTLTITGAKR